MRASPLTEYQAELVTTCYTPENPLQQLDCRLFPIETKSRSLSDLALTWCAGAETGPRPCSPRQLTALLSSDNREGEIDAALLRDRH